MVPQGVRRARPGKRSGGRSGSCDNGAVSATRKSRPAGRNGSAGTMTADGHARSQRRADMLRLAGELFAQKGYRATTVREIADAAGILSGSLYHHFDSKESIGDEILSGFMSEVLADYRAAVAAAADPRAVLEQIVRSTSVTLARNRAALAMLQNDWSFFSTQPRFAYLRKALREIERIWITQLELGVQSGVFRADLDAKLTYRLLRDVLWIPAQWRRTASYSTDQVVDGFLRLLFDGITGRPAVTL
jgi:TetR/AcrR family transcriptional regulator, cholesterol catabolism regulator